MVVSMLLVRVLVQQNHENHEHRWQKNYRRAEEEERDDPFHQALLPFYFLTQISSSPSMLPRHDSPACGWGRRILHLQTQPGAPETLAAAKSAEPTKAGLERQSDFLMWSCRDRRYKNLPGDGPSRSLWSVIFCIWMQTGVDRRILLFLPSIPRSYTHKSHC